MDDWLIEIPSSGKSFDGPRMAVAPSDGGKGRRGSQCPVVSTIRIFINGRLAIEPTAGAHPFSVKRRDSWGGLVHEYERAADSTDLCNLQHLSNASRRMTDHDVIGAL